MIKKVFCIDDDLMTLKLLDFKIKSSFFGEQIFKFNKAEEALGWLKEKTEHHLFGSAISYPLLIFLDLNLPELNGWQFLDKFTKDYLSAFPGSKVIILSSSVNHQDFRQARNYEIVIDFICKPLRTQDIIKLKENFFLRPFFKEK